MIGTLVTVLPTFNGFKTLPMIGIDASPPNNFKNVLLFIPSFKPIRPPSAFKSLFFLPPVSMFFNTFSNCKIPSSVSFGVLGVFVISIASRDIAVAALSASASDIFKSFIILSLISFLYFKILSSDLFIFLAASNISLTTWTLSSPILLWKFLTISLAMIPSLILTFPWSLGSSNILFNDFGFTIFKTSEGYWTLSLLLPI